MTGDRVLFQAHAAGSGSASAAASRARYAARGSSTHAQAGQVVGLPLHVEQPPLGVLVGEQVDQAHQRHLGGVALAVEHRLAREQPADRDAVQPAGEPAVAPGLDRVHPAELVEPEVRRPDVAVDPGAAAAAGRRRRRSPRRQAVSTRISNRGPTRRSDRLTRSPSSGSTPRVRRAPPARARRPRRTASGRVPRAVGRQQRARLRGRRRSRPGRRRPATAPAAGTPTASAGLHGRHAANDGASPAGLLDLGMRSRVRTGPLPRRP